jgi:peptide/nickel transport system permease protein
MSNPKKIAALLFCIGALHLAVCFAGFLAPYDFAEQDRTFPFAPPSRLHFHIGRETIPGRPSVCQLVERPGTFGIYEEDQHKCFPLNFFVRGSEYRVFGLFKSEWHLFGVGKPAKVFLMGTDSYGRDVFSRLIYGGQISLFFGLLATALSLGIGMLLGTAAGYYGGWVDALIMRGGELFLALPWLYLLFALRAFLPLHIGPAQAFSLLIAVIGLVGWARPARLIRGIVLSGRERHYVLAARVCGASDWYLMRRHLVPQTYSILLTQAALLIPQYILAEVTLSFVGLGVGEPAPSWGNMLAMLQQYDVLVSYWWMWAPGLLLIPVFLSYLLLAGLVQQRESLCRA